MQDCYSISSNISWKLLKDNVVAVNLDDGNYFTFNETASIIWQQVAEEKSIDEIHTYMQSEFVGETEATLKEDIAEIIHHWLSEKLIHPK
jgi:predicted house-cleaning noncanonical NTP pyrophosphatase (MazG superfamily)